jgi:hypothetical protein
MRDVRFGKGVVVHDTTRKGMSRGSMYGWEESYKLTENGTAGASRER